MEMWILERNCGLSDDKAELGKRTKWLVAFSSIASFQGGAGRENGASTACFTAVRLKMSTFCDATKWLT